MALTRMTDGCAISRAEVSPSASASAPRSIALQIGGQLFGTVFHHAGAGDPAPFCFEADFRLMGNIPGAKVLKGIWAVDGQGQPEAAEKNAEA